MQVKEFKTLQLEYADQTILKVCLNRPEVRNAINFQMMQDLLSLWQSLYVDSRNIICIILTGAEKAFCSGADLKERNSIDLPTWRKQHGVFEQSMLAMLDCPVPVIAAVNGVAFGGGLELVLASDFAYAVTTASFSMPEVKVGLMPGALGTQQLPRACGIRRAKELIFTGAQFSAQEAYDWGIINKLCDAETLLKEVTLTAQTISVHAPFAIRQAKKAINLSQHIDLKSGFFFELEAYNRLLNTKDREEGIRAFNEKRKPHFCGE